MNAILVSRNGFPSMRMVTEKLNNAGVNVNLLRRRDGQWDIAPTEPIDALIRWGSIARSGGSTTTYNKAKAIRLASNKAEARHILFYNQVSNFPVSIVGDGGRFVGPGPLPWVFRPPRHRGGNNFYMVDDPRDIKNVPLELGWYVSSFYPKQNEYRVHVVSGRVLIVNEKVPREGQEDKRSEPIWNHHINDFYFQVLRWRDWPLEVIKVAIAATKELGLDFAGVDVMANAPPDGEKVWPRAVVCEVNTAPTVNEPYSSDKYAAYFKWLLQEKREWEDIDSTHPPDYAFRGEL